MASFGSKTAAGSGQSSALRAAESILPRIIDLRAGTFDEHSMRGNSNGSALLRWNVEIAALAVFLGHLGHAGFGFFGAGDRPSPSPSRLREGGVDQSGLLFRREGSDLLRDLH